MDIACVLDIWISVVVMFVDWCILSLTEVFIQPQHTQCPSLCLMERTPLHMFGWLYVILLINRFYAICFCTDRSSRIIILFILFSLFVFSLFFPDIRFVLLYSPFSLCVPWLMIYTCCQKILCTDRSSRIIILFILFSLFVLSLFFPEICFVLLYAPTHPFPCVPWLPTGLFLMNMNMNMNMNDCDLLPSNTTSKRSDAHLP